MLTSLIESLRRIPKKLFIVDGIGALLTTFLLSVILTKFESFFGIPSSTLYLMAVFPVVYFIFDLYAYNASSEYTGRNLKMIAIMNLLYCCISFGFCIYHMQEVTIWGWLYVLGEIAIIIFLSIFEISVGNGLK